MSPVPPTDAKLRYVVVMALAMTAAFAARDALAGHGPFNLYSGFLAVVLVAMIIGKIARKRTGIHLAPVHCPNCNAPQPFIRKPGSVRQAMWGGYTCAACGAGIDKSGRKVEG